MSEGRVAFVVLGCAKNQVEAESMSARLARQGWDLTADLPSSDLVVVHSCGFLESARTEARETLAKVRRAAPKAFVVLTGCFAQFLNGAKIPEIDAALGTGQLDKLMDVLRARRALPLIDRPASPAGYHDAKTPRPLRPGQVSAYLRVGEGCDHRCTFCIIPQLRGSQRSRLEKDILEEAEGLVARGIGELNIISQDTTNYGADRGNRALVPLLRRMAAWPELRWVRLLYAYPTEVGEDLIDLLAEEPKLCGYLDMPLQHFSGRILKAMAREHSHEQTRALLNRLRDRVPHLALRTTFIVGFPGETEEDFKEVLDVVQEGYFEQVGVFPYSFESRSPSARLPDLVPTEVVQERWERLLDAHQSVKTKKDRARRGTDVAVLVERTADGQWAARAAHQAPEVDGQVRLARPPAAPGFYACRITGTRDIDLEGTLKINGRPARPRRRAAVAP